MCNSLIKTHCKPLLAVVLGMGVTGAALAAAPLHENNVSMQCADRKITVEATCFPYAGSIMACTRQSIRFFGADGKPLGAHVFPTKPLKGADYPVVAEQFGELNCVETKTREKFIVATMDNGGNCDACEGNDVFSLDGTLVGSTRDKKKANASLNAAIDATFDEHAKHVLNHQSLDKLYEHTGAE